MRFPWLQVDADFIGAKAADLGTYLRISRREAMGLALDLWTWALARAKDDAPPEGIVSGTGAEPDRLLAGSVGWTGPAEQFSEALVAVGMAVRVETGYRLTGFDRYKATWEKNRRRTGGKPERNRTGTGEEPARKTQTQTQTQTQKKEETYSAGAAAPPASQGALLDVQADTPPPLPERPKRGPSTTAMGEFIDWARAEVKPRLPADAMDPAAGLKAHERVRLGEAVKDHGLESVKAAFRLFMDWAVAESKGYSVGFFANQWETWVRQAKATVAPAGRHNAVGRGAEGPTRECAGCGEETGEGQQHGQTWVGLYCGCGAALFRLATPPADVELWARNRRAGRAA